MRRSPTNRLVAAADALRDFLASRSAATGFCAGALPTPDDPHHDAAWLDTTVSDAASPNAPLAELDPAVEILLGATQGRPARGADAASVLQAAAPLRLAHTDWLYHHLEVTGPADQVARFAQAAAGGGIIPWQLDLDRLEEDFFHALVAPPAPQQRSLSLAGARILAGELREAVARRHELAVARVGHSRAAPFDLHALCPVPADLLRRGPDDPAALAWLWTRWGTTQALRHVTAVPAAPGGARAFCVRFWSADWTPWRALEALGQKWPALRITVRPVYARP
jgi:hypothetical protein